MNTTKNVKVTMSNNKQDMLRFLESIREIIKDDKSLSERVEYTLNNYKKARKSEVFEVVEEVQDKFMPTLFDQVEESGESELDVSADEEETVEKPAKKTIIENEVKKLKPKKASTTKKLSPEEIKSPVSTESLPLAVLFPEELDIPNLGKLKAVPDTDMQELAKALNDEGRQFFFATFWTPKMIKEYSYAETREVNKVKSFPNDLDILQPVYFCEGLKRMWANSLYTEAMFCFNEDSLEHLVEKNPYNGEPYRIRVSRGMEFELYELVQE